MTDEHLKRARAYLSKAQEELDIALKVKRRKQEQQLMNGAREHFSNSKVLNSLPGELQKLLPTIFSGETKRINAYTETYQEVNLHFGLTQIFLLIADKDGSYTKRRGVAITAKDTGSLPRVVTDFRKVGKYNLISTKELERFHKKTGKYLSIESEEKIPSTVYLPKQ